MDDLRDRFAALDRIAVPDLWSDIDRRAATAMTASSVRGQLSWRADRRPFRPTPVPILLLLGLLLTLAVTFVTVGSRLPDLWAALLPSPVPSHPAEPDVADVAGAFVTTGTMDAGCSWCQAVVLADGRVLVVGGALSHVYDPATWAFTPVEGLPDRGTTVLLDDGRVLVASTNESGTYDLAIFDPATGTSDLVDERSNVGLAATRLDDGSVLLLGAEPAGAGPGAALTFDPATRELSPTGPTLAQRQNDVRLAPLPDGRVLVVGGSADGRSAEIYDPTTRTFAATGSMNAQRGAFTATALPDGRVLIVGGDSGTETLASTEIFDPATGTFTLSGPMEQPRFWHAAALLPDGRVLVVGGSSSGVRADAGTFSEVYDPKTGRFTRGPVTNQPRVAATAVSLPQGVLVLGHYPGNVGGNAAAGRTAELFALGPVEPPVGCCLDDPGFISVSASAEQEAARRAALVVPAGGLEGATGASVFINVDWQGGGTGHGGELPLPDCAGGCSIPLGLALEGSSVRQEAVVTATVDIAYQGPPPPQASGIEVVIEP